MPRERMTHQVPEPTTEDLERIGKMLRQVGGKNVVWGASDSLNVWIIEQRAKLDQQMSKRIQTASWSLVVVTLGLTACTAALIWATLVS